MRKQTAQTARRHAEACDKTVPVVRTHSSILVVFALESVVSCAMGLNVPGHSDVLPVTLRISPMPI